MKKRVIFLFLLAAHILTIGYGKNQAYYENLIKLGHKEKENRNYAKAMEYLMEVKIYANENQLLDMQSVALNSMGIVYLKILDYEKAMECYLDAYQIASELANDKRKGIILNNIAVLYSENNDFDKALEYLDIAYKIAKELNNSASMLTTLNNMSSYSIKKGDWEQTGKYLAKAEKILKNYSADTLYIFAIQYQKTEYFYFKKEYDLAEQLALDALNQDVGKWDKDLEIEYLLTLSKIYHAKKMTPQAISFAKDALKNIPNLPMTIEIYTHLSDLYRAANLPSLVMQCQDSIIMMKDSLAKLNNMSQLQRGQIQFDMRNLEKKMEENNARQKQERIIFTFIFLFAIALFLLILYIRTTKNKQSKITAELKFEKEKNENLVLEKRLREQETQALLEQTAYKNEIDLKNKQLVSQTLFQLSKNELIEEISHALSNIPNQSDIPELQPIIHKMQSQIKELSGEDWNSFLIYFDQTNPSFLAILQEKHPDLTANDIRFLSYVYLNLDTKEIAKLLHITPEYCKKKKQNLAHKLEVPSSKLFNYLSNMS